MPSSTPIPPGAFDRIDTLKARGRGVGLVISPWNFPVAIPCGGVTAALSAGNTVIFKPSSEAIPTAWILAQCFWRAGVPRTALQFLPCPGGKVGGALTNHPDTDFVILTGGTDTGLKIIQQRPGIYLAAETGGKNATIVTDMADRDQAIKNVVYSAFGNCGQKCSATSLLILENTIYEDEHFRYQLVDAAGSFATGSAWAFESRMGALIKPPSGDLERALTVLEEGETWALEPAMVDDNPYLWSPGIKYGVRPGSYTHMTELFGPVLGVMRADNLDEAIELVNRDRLRADLRAGEPGLAGAGGLEGGRSRGQPVHQPGHHRGHHPCASPLAAWANPPWGRGSRPAARTMWPSSWISRKPGRPKPE